MKIKVTAELRVPDEARPAVGSVHEVVRQQQGERPLYFINPTPEYPTQMVGVAPEECEVVA